MNRRTALLVLGALLALASTSCVSLPDQGSVHTVQVADRADAEALIDYTPPGPEKGSDPVPLVGGWLDAMRATPLNTSVARQFLTTDSSEEWVPERGTLVYGSRRLVATPGGTVELHLGGVVALDARGSWIGDPTDGRGTTLILHLAKEDGQWRISDPPDRLVIPQSHFEAQYEQYFLYFFDRAAQVLVPEPVYVPRGMQAPTLLVSGLLAGPAPSRQGVERTFVPRGTALDGISVPVSRDGTAEVPLSDQVLDVDDAQLNLIFAQLAWTLGQISGVARMRVTVGGTPVDLPGSRLDVSVGEWSQFDPAVAWASSSLFGIRRGRVVVIDGAQDEQRVTGPFGTQPLGIRSIAVDLPARHVAAVTTDGSRLLEGARDQVPGNGSAFPRTVAVGTDLLRPSYDLYGQLWDIDRTARGASVLVVRAGSRHVVTVPGVTGQEVERFLLSRDGTRLVAVLRRAGRDVLVVSRVLRDTEGRVRGLTRGKELSLAGAGVTSIKDVAFRAPGSLTVLAGQRGGISQVLIVKIDGSSTPEDLSTDAELLRDRATHVTSSPAVNTPIYVGTVSGQMFSLASTGRWTGTSIEPGLRAATFVG